MNLGVVEFCSFLISKNQKYYQSHWCSIRCKMYQHVTPKTSPQSWHNENGSVLFSSSLSDLLSPCHISALNVFFFSILNTTLCLSLHHHQGGQSDSGMGLSSDNMQTLKRLESLAGRPLSIMALAYVCTTPLITPSTCPASGKSAHN